MVKFFGVALVAAVPSSVFASVGVISLESVSPNVCSTPGCNFDCAGGYDVTQIGDDLALASTYSGTECSCYEGVGTVSSGVASGSFPTGSSGTIPFTAQVEDNKIVVLTTVSGTPCTGTYSIQSGTVLGAGTGSGAGAASVAVGALAFAAAVVLM
jgi:hypothetical protein